MEYALKHWKNTNLSTSYPSVSAGLQAPIARQTTHKAPIRRVRPGEPTDARSSCLDAAGGICRAAPLRS